MLSLLLSLVNSFSLSGSPRDFYRNQVNVKIQCWTHILDSPLSWKERKNAFEQLSVLYHEQYVLDNVPGYTNYSYIDLSNMNATEAEATTWWIDLDH